jgi:hypothetical protein
MADILLMGLNEWDDWNGGKSGWKVKARGKLSRENRNRAKR